METLMDDMYTEDEMNKDCLLVKCKEVIESLNSEIEEERIAYKILKQENERLKAVEDEISKVYTENEELQK